MWFSWSSPRPQHALMHITLTDKSSPEPVVLPKYHFLEWYVQMQVTIAIEYDFVSSPTPLCPKGMTYQCSRSYLYCKIILVNILFKQDS
jgi:hypothetical protein